jgi:hypothetical protein
MMGWRPSFFFIANFPFLSLFILYNNHNLTLGIVMGWLLGSL